MAAVLAASLVGGGTGEGQGIRRTSGGFGEEPRGDWKWNEEDILSSRLAEADGRMRKESKGGGGKAA